MFRKFFVSIAVVVLAVAGQACATLPYTGFTGVAVPGYEAATVVARNAAMRYQIMAAGGWAPYPPYGYRRGDTVLPVCRPQDIPSGMPAVSEAVPIRVEKSTLHKILHTGAATAVGGGLGTVAVGGSRGAGGGSAAGGGVGGWLALDEHDYCLLLPPASQPRQPGDPFVRIINPSNGVASVFDGERQVAEINPQRAVELPPAASAEGYQVRFRPYDGKTLKFVSAQSAGLRPEGDFILRVVP